MPVTVPDLLKRMNARQLERQAAAYQPTPYAPDSFHPPIENPIDTDGNHKSWRDLAWVWISLLSVLGIELLFLAFGP